MNAKQMTDLMFQAIEKKEEPGKSIKFSVGLMDAHTHYELYLRSDLDQKHNELILSGTYRTWDEPMTIKQSFARAELFDLFKALREIGNAYIRELNSTRERPDNDVVGDKIRSNNKFKTWTSPSE